MPERAAEPILTLQVEFMGDCALVHCHGRLIAEVSGNFYVRIHKLIPDHKRIVLDLTDLAHMDSMGLGALVRLLVSAKTSGCRLELINLGKKIKQLLGMTHLLGAFGAIGEQGITLGF